MSAASAVLRAATRADMPALLQAEQASFPGGAQDEWLLAPLILDQGAWLYQEGSELVGYALTMARASRAGVAFLFSFAVLPAARRRGVGRAFFRDLAGALAERGFRELELYVAPDNVPALRIYQGAGFREVARHPDLFGAGEDRLELRGELKPASRGPTVSGG